MRGSCSFKPSMLQRVNQLSPSHMGASTCRSTGSPSERVSSLTIMGNRIVVGCAAAAWPSSVLPALVVRSLAHLGVELPDERGDQRRGGNRGEGIHGLRQRARNHAALIIGHRLQRLSRAGLIGGPQEVRHHLVHDARLGGVNMRLAHRARGQQGAVHARALEFVMQGLRESIHARLGKYVGGVIGNGDIPGCGTHVAQCSFATFNHGAQNRAAQAEHRRGIELKLIGLIIPVLPHKGAKGGNPGGIDGDVNVPGADVLNEVGDLIVLGEVTGKNLGRNVVLCAEFFREIRKYGLTPGH